MANGMSPEVMFTLAASLLLLKKKQTKQNKIPNSIYLAVSKNSSLLIDETI